MSTFDPEYVNAHKSRLLGKGGEFFGRKGLNTVKIVYKTSRISQEGLQEFLRYPLGNNGSAGAQFNDIRHLFHMHANMVEKLLFSSMNLPEKIPDGRKRKKRKEKKIADP